MMKLALGVLAFANFIGGNVLANEAEKVVSMKAPSQPVGGGLSVVLCNALSAKDMRRYQGLKMDMNVVKTRLAEVVDRIINHETDRKKQPNIKIVETLKKGTIPLPSDVAYEIYFEGTPLGNPNLTKKLSHSIARKLAAENYDKKDIKFIFPEIYQYILEDLSNPNVTFEALPAANAAALEVLNDMQGEDPAEN
ncbi:ABC transporter ATP-binding, putative [Babesia ovis]|uniref:ABC transporter ATP-binding, putative n=1 Tax=Babesia ovis TaxID=5869 RepID=A0A9W5T9S3_BABOV|nr:ABC transporter ATP-binding, putative [Babesia ovis]